MEQLNKQEWINAIKEEMNSLTGYADTRSDIQTQQTSDDSEAQDIISHVRILGGDIKEIEDGAILAFTNNKTSLYSILDFLDENEYVFDYEVSLMQVELNGVNVDVSDTIDIDDVRDMNNFYFKIFIYLDPDIVNFDPVYVNSDDVIDDNEYFDYVEDVGSYMQFDGDLQESIYIYEDKDGAKIKILPPQTTDSDEYFDITKYNIDAIKNNKKIQKFTDLGFTITSNLKNSDIDYEMHGKPVVAKIFDIEANGGRENIFTEMLKCLSECDDVNLYTDSSDKTLTEITRKIKMNFQGKRRIKMQCAKGFKYDAARRVCVKISGSDMMTMRRSHIQASRTKKAAGAAFKIRMLRKTRKANRFRQMQGIKPTRM